MLKQQRSLRKTNLVIIQCFPQNKVYPNPAQLSSKSLLIEEFFISAYSKNLEQPGSLQFKNFDKASFSISINLKQVDSCFEFTQTNLILISKIF